MQPDLTVAQLIELEVVAREEISKLESQREAAGESGETDAISPDVAIGRLSRLDSMQMQEIAKDAQRRRELRLFELQKALERMDDGDYGLCAECGNWIPFERLVERPEVVRCTGCA